MLIGKKEGGSFVINAVSCSSGTKLTKDGGSWMNCQLQSIHRLLIAVSRLALI